MTDLDRAVALLGPLEGRIMRAVWSGQVGEAFTVRDVHALMPELAYTTVMTTLGRLAEKHVLISYAEPGRRAYVYRAAATSTVFLARSSARAAANVVARYGDAALAAFVEQLAGLTPEQRRRLEELRE